MPHVPTVLGPVEVASLGRTLMHEHIFILTADVQQNYPEEWGDSVPHTTVGKYVRVVVTGSVPQSTIPPYPHRRGGSESIWLRKDTR
jgi:hypothetical protein